MLAIIALLILNISFACGPGFQTINLEDPGGPFHNIPRDNQDGLGTCYANTAKNLLVGLSQGQMNASFLDLAIQYKARTEGVGDNGIDSGNSCRLLNLISSGPGVCPQDQSPIETGDTDGIQTLLFPQESARGVQANILVNLNNLASIRENLYTEGKRNRSLIGLEGKAYDMISAIRNNPNIEIPLPVVSSVEINSSTLEKFYDKAARPRSELPNFLSEYQNRIARVKPLLLDAMVANKTPIEIQAIYEEHVNSWLKSQGIDLGTQPITGYDSPNLSQRVRDSLTFLQTFGGINFQTQEGLAAACSSNPMTKFVEDLLSVVQQLQRNGGSSEALFNSDRSLKSSVELLQLAIAPACLNPANRQRLTFTPTCRQISFSERTPVAQKAAEMRTAVLASLQNNLPVGHSYPTSPTMKHINTIVGMKFDEATAQCQYLIRESMTGESTWQNESTLAQSVENLSIVGRTNR